MYYIISLKHTSKGDTALTFWGKNQCGYTWHRDRAGLYSLAEALTCAAEDNPMVKQEDVDPFWMNALDFEDKYISVPNNSTVRQVLKLDEKQMKPKKYRSCKMTFLNTPVTESLLT
jgi:hypothetical protein